MTLKEQIRAALGLQPETKLAYQDKLEDGTIITTEADALEVGVSVSVLTEDGTTMPLPPGSYKTEAGVGFEVETEGVISAMDEAEETEETEETEEVADETEARKDEDEMYKEEDLSTENVREPKKIKETTEIEFSKDEVIAEVSNAVKEMLSSMQKDINDIKDIIDGSTATLEEEIVSVTAEKEELSKKVKELEKAPATTPETLTKFSKENNTINVSKAEYNKMSSRERYFYNLSISKK